MDIDQIATFIAIVRAGGLTRAAARLHRSQPAISRRLGLLEAELGAPLFERSPGGVRLTDVGRAFLPHAEAMLAAMNDAGEAVRDQLREGAGGASVAIVGTAVDRRLAQLLSQFSRQRPHAALRVLTASSEEISGLVRRGEVTLGVRYFVDRDPDLACRTIGREAMVVVGPPGALAGARRAGDLARERWIGFPARGAKEAFGRLLRRQFTAAGLQDVEVMEVDSLSAQKRLAEAGFGLALLPKSSVAEELEAGTLRLLEAPGVAADVPIVCVHRRSGYLSPAARLLADLLAEAWAPSDARN